LDLAVILDVVYNHFVQTEIILRFIRTITSSANRKPTGGDSINSMAELGAGPGILHHNGRYWIDEFHFDGSGSTPPMRSMINRTNTSLARLPAAREAAAPRSIILIAENERQVTKLIRPRSESGDDLDAVWNDDFHHSAVVALTGRRKRTTAIFSARRRNLFRSQVRLFVSRTTLFLAGSTARTPAFGSPRTHSSPSLRTTIKFRIRRRANAYDFKVHPAVIAR